MFSCLKACLSLGLHEILICHILASILTRYNLFDLLVSPTQTNKKQLLSTHNKYLKNKGLFITQVHIDVNDNTNAMNCYSSHFQHTKICSLRAVTGLSKFMMFQRDILDKNLSSYQINEELFIDRVTVMLLLNVHVNPKLPKNLV